MKFATQVFRFSDVNLDWVAMICGYRSVVDFLVWAEPHIVRGDN